MCSQYGLKSYQPLLLNRCKSNYKFWIKITLSSALLHDVVSTHLIQIIFRSFKWALSSDSGESKESSEVSPSELPGNLGKLGLQMTRRLGVLTRKVMGPIFSVIV